MELFLGIAIVSFVLVVTTDTLQQRRRNKNWQRGSDGQVRAKTAQSHLIAKNR